MRRQGGEPGDWSYAALSCLGWTELQQGCGALLHAVLPDRMLLSLQNNTNEVKFLDTASKFIKSRGATEAEIDILHIFKSFSVKEKID